MYIKIIETSVKYKEQKIGHTLVGTDVQIKH